MSSENWRPVLSTPAERDLTEITRWTAENFGARQAVAYRDLILEALIQLRLGPEVPGARPRPELGLRLYTLNAARLGKPSRHFLLYRPRDGRVIEILRVLHQSMDIERHVPPSGTEADTPSTS